jgi:hypothetical protein
MGIIYLWIILNKIYKLEEKYKYIHELYNKTMVWVLPQLTWDTFLF